MGACYCDEMVFEPFAFFYYTVFDYLCFTLMFHR